MAGSHSGVPIARAAGHAGRPPSGRCPTQSVPRGLRGGEPIGVPQRRRAHRCSFSSRRCKTAAKRPKKLQLVQTPLEPSLGPPRRNRFRSTGMAGGQREFFPARHDPFWGPRQQGFPLGEIPQRAGETRTGTTDKPHGAGKGTPDKRRNGDFPKWFRFWRSKWFRIRPDTHKTAKDQGLELGEIPYRGKSPG